MSFLTLDLNLLRVFDAVMTEQNLTRAADRLATTQPAVSNALKRLRETLDDELLIRTAHGMKPTARAEELWPPIRTALSTIEAAVTPENFDVSEAQTVFRMAMVDSTAAPLLPPLMRAIKQEAPGLDIRMPPLTTRDPRPMLMQSDIDFAVGSFPGVVAQLAGSQDAAMPIRHQRLYGGKVVAIMRRDHPLADSELTLDNYCAAQHALVSFSGRAHGPVDVVLGNLGRKRRIALTVNQYAPLGRVIAETDLIAIVPRHLITPMGMRDLVIEKTVPFELPPVHVDMLWHERDTRNPSHKWMRNKLIEISNAAHIADGGNGGR